MHDVCSTRDERLAEQLTRSRTPTGPGSAPQRCVIVSPGSDLSVRHGTPPVRVIGQIEPGTFFAQIHSWSSESHDLDPSGVERDEIHAVGAVRSRADRSADLCGGCRGFHRCHTMGLCRPFSSSGFDRPGSSDRTGLVAGIGRISTLVGPSGPAILRCPRSGSASRPYPRPRSRSAWQWCACRSRPAGRDA